jgi:hypothetical protein
MVEIIKNRTGNKELIRQQNMILEDDLVVEIREGINIYDYS